MFNLPSHPIILLGLLVLAVAGLLYLSSRLDRILPRGSRVEGAVQRWSGVVQALIVAVGSLMAVNLVYTGDAPTWRWLTVGLFLAAIWAGRLALSDWGNGIVLRAEGSLRKGGRLSFGSSSGRIRRLGLRSAEVEAEDGRLLRLPYTSLAGAAIETSPEEAANRSHTFAVMVESDVSPAEVMHRITTAALLCPWSTTEPHPTVRLAEREGHRSRFEVTVHPVDPAYASRIEGAVRESLDVGA